MIKTIKLGKLEGGEVAIYFYWMKNDKNNQII